ncbi:hypothetical protein HDE_05989 [Halotydeus destructor]|nr:hypothetical protein HDE_05989 [Halotydeus destructor]
MKLLLISTLIASSIYMSIERSAEDFNCDFTHGFCNYTLPQSEGMVIAQDASNRSYITFSDDYNNGYLTSPR